MFMEILPHQIQYLDNQGISHRIEDLIADPPIHNDLFGSENGKMLGDIGLLHS